MPEGYAKNILKVSLDRHTSQALHLCQMPEMPEEPAMENQNSEAPYYPYIPFQTFIGLLDRLKQSGVPNRIDRTYLSYTSGSIQTYLLNTLKAFRLIDDSGRPTPALVALAENEDERPTRIAEIVRYHYADALKLGTGATPGELAEVFRDKYGLGGDTARKGITFFLNAANFGGVEVSQHYKLPRGSSGSGTRVARRTPTRRRAVRRDSGNGGGGDYTPPSAPTLDTLKTRYVEMLMKRVEEQDEVDERLLDRIEALLGYEGSQAHEEGEDEE